MSINTMALYRAWEQLDNGARAQLRRVSEPDELKDIPVFYRLVSSFGWDNPVNQKPLLRMVFCLTAGRNAVCHKEKGAEEKYGISVGKALANSQQRINERRVFQLLRSEWPADMVQLRRLLAHAEPILYWPDFANQLIWWSPKERRQLLEDFVIASPQKKNQ
ncbi:CRISPR-associated protein [Citrobacter amalonaticus]|nr:CRISPR-associated protein [Citrobacter amalonaticus]